MANYRKWLFLSLISVSVTYLLLQLLVHFTSPLPEPEGNHFAVDQHWVHYVCKGTGDQIVFFESGVYADSQQSWQGISRRLFGSAKTCYYDRLGYGWSTPQPEGYTAEQQVEMLGKVINEVADNKPVILVGHAYGGILARQFANTNPDRVSAILLLDSAHEEQHARLGDAFSPITVAQAQRTKIAAVTGLSMIRAWFGNLGNDNEMESRIAMQRASVEFADTMLNYVKQGALETPLKDMNYKLGDIPMVLLKHDPQVYVEEDSPQVSQTWSELQQELSALSSESQLRTVTQAGHNIHLDQPDVVVEVIEELLRQG